MYSIHISQRLIACHAYPPLVFLAESMGSTPSLEWNGMGKDGKGWMILFSLSHCLDLLVWYVLIMGDLELPFLNLYIDPFAPL